MRWSKLKQRTEERFAEKLQGRMQVHLTRYRWTRNEDGELYVLMDGERIYSASYWAHANAFEDRKSELQGAPDHAVNARQTAIETLRDEGCSTDQKLAQKLLQSLSLSIDAMLASNYPFVRGLAVADRRTGTRRLRALNAAAEHPFVRRVYQERLNAELV